MIEFVASISVVGWIVLAILALFIWNLPTMIAGLRGKIQILRRLTPDKNRRAEQQYQQQ